MPLFEEDNLRKESVLKHFLEIRPVEEDGL